MRYERKQGKIEKKNKNEALLRHRNAIFATVAVTRGISLWCRKCKALSERAFVLYRQQHEEVI